MNLEVVYKLFKSAIMTAGEMPDDKNYRTETDILGLMQLSVDSLTGIHTVRALGNFDLVGGHVNNGLIRSYGLVKLACVATNAELGYIDADIASAIKQACEELSSGSLNAEPIAALQGGAGTSTNMYVNELIANRALIILGKKTTDHNIISPLDHVNKHQSTNDTYPTALRIAAMYALSRLEQAVSELADEFQKKEQLFADVVKLGRTQLQDAVAITVGREMGSYAEAFSRDRWRIYKCQERLRVVNLGATAIGTGLGAPQKYIFKVVDNLRKITKLPLARAENLVQATQNCDEIVEVSGILKALAVNIFKITSDLRLLSSGPDAGFGELKLPLRQAGSSIMPGKVNPVIAEMAAQVAIQAISRDAAISMAAMSGQLELNAFMPCIAHNLLSMLDELIIACTKVRLLLVQGLEVDREKCEKSLHSSTAIITAFINKIGYEKASEVAVKAVQEKKTVKEILLAEKLCTQEEYDQLTNAEAILALGFREKTNANDT